MYEIVRTIRDHAMLFDEACYKFTEAYFLLQVLLSSILAP